MFEFDAQKEIFHLHNSMISFVLGIDHYQWEHDEPVIMYFGAAIDDPACTFNRVDMKQGTSFDSLRQRLPYACPTDGRGDYRPPLVSARQENGQKCTELLYEGYEHYQGKKPLPGLPATYTEADSEAETLVLRLKDAVTGLRTEISYTLFSDRPVMTSSLFFQNTGSEPLTLLRAGSMCMQLPGQYDMLHLQGAWAKERTVVRVPAGCGLTRTISSERGASGHEHNPFAALLEHGTTEFDGVCCGFMLIYSGDFEITCDENAYGTTRLIAGLNPRTFEWRLAPGETFRTPECAAVWSEHGLNGMSRAFHSLIRERVCRGPWRDRPRPVLINNWEGTYFNFNHEKIMSIARQAAKIGVELFVLDDGWFGKRDNDRCSLGDWVVNRQKLPFGIDGLARDINALGMKFGLWFEPEMISPDSDLYRAHPDWCLHVPGRPRTESRQQLILDMSRTDVQDYVAEAVAAVLRSAPISYVKWDMNRNFKEAGSALTQRQGEVAHRYMLGLYRVMDRIVTEFPEVLFEGCSGGGGRFDAGILYYMPQIWTSDDSDAVQRLEIQYGTSLCYPTSAMGAHVSASPNHQLHRETSLQMRGDVALGGNFGYELDLSAQTKEDIELMRAQVERMKKLRVTTAYGEFTRLLSPFEGNVTAWQFADRQRVIFCAYRRLNKIGDAPLFIRLRDIPEGKYRDEEGNVYTRRDLEGAGINPVFEARDFTSFVKVLEKI